MTFIQGDTQFSRLARLEQTPLQRNPYSWMENLQLPDIQNRATLIGQQDILFCLLLLNQLSLEINLFCREMNPRSFSLLLIIQRSHIRKKDSRYRYFVLL